MAHIWILGESWVTNATHFKGFDHFVSTTFHSGVDPLQQALQAAGHEVRWMPSHEAQQNFPGEKSELNGVDIIILSDIGANTLLLHPKTWLEGIPTPNRLKMLRDWTLEGGRLVMCGGYLSFAGISASGFYHRSPIEEVLGVEISPFDDRVEVPEGAVARVEQAEHPILRGIESTWPILLGYNRIKTRPGTEVLASINGDDPLLAVSQQGKGRSLVWTSDIGPHWCPSPFVQWDGYQRLWNQAVEWLCRA
ncbi:MAG TPA: glutamine amidotransferase [Ktedonobacteraceae bacterium]|nr:glutamine amidotransferase [Ktedonobacteraceae bacterium]